MDSPIVTMTTDFGMKDHYAGTMKGVIASICPEARLIDITHEIPPFSLYEGAYAIAQAAPFFPAGTVHLVVVDPGVGSKRRAILAEAGNQLLLAPDNGVLSLTLQSCREFQVRELTNAALWRPTPSCTFHGRDIFAPVGAALAGGKARPEDVGPLITDVNLLSKVFPAMGEDSRWEGIVLSVDRFGNLITNFRSSDFAAQLANGFALTAAHRTVGELRRTFAEAPETGLFVYPGSSGYLEIGMNQRSAASELGLQAGQPVYLRSGIDGTI